MARVFISYASVDLDLACEVHRWLVEDSHEVFLDQDPRDGIAIGEQWRQRLRERLRWADAVACVVTSAAVASSWCTAEIATAQSRGSRLLPLLAEPDLTHPLLTEVQHTDMTQNPTSARAALIAALRRIDAAGGSGWPDDRSPFPGLRPFDSDRHRVFFGRADEIKQLVELVRSAAEGAALLVAGPSGCGKSSLVRAGRVPVLADEPGWRVLPPILPGADPVGALARELAAAARRIGLGWTVEHVHHRLGENGFVALADELLLADSDGPQRRLLVVVDQVEELLTQAVPGQRTRFASLEVSFTPDGHILATGSVDGNTILWNLTDPRHPHRLGAPLTAPTNLPDRSNGVHAVAFASEGRMLATGRVDQTVILWDVSDPVRPRRLGPPLIGHTAEVNSVAFSPDGRTLATGSFDRTVILWDLTDPTRARPLGLPLVGHRTGVGSVAFAPDGNTLATAASSDGTVILWDLIDVTRPQRLGQPLAGHNSWVSSVVFSPEGRTLATASADRTVILWDLTSLNHLRDHAVERACAIAGGGLDRDEWARYIPGLPYQNTCST